jgi:negative regulator of sigma-B (phosphoserine phosphatase)
MGPMSGATAAHPRPLLDWGVASRALAGESESGDACVVAPFVGGVLAGVIDGLGHGPEAAEAARVAVATLKADPGAQVIDLVRSCHESMRRTRGAALSLASFHESTGTMTWIGVGNVEGALFRIDRNAAPPRDALMLRSGVVGYQLPPLRAATHHIHAGDVLLLVTDGISGGYYTRSPIGHAPQETADDILERCGRSTDDALVLVATYLGGQS